MKYFLTTLTTIMAFGLLVFSVPVFAQEMLENHTGGTPDGQPPSVETVCDTYAGQAFGLCNAFCEAMDCELAEDLDPNTNPAASASACSKVRTKFVQVTDEEPPCLPELCPCVNAGIPQWDLAAEGTADWTSPTYNCGCGDGTLCAFDADPYTWIVNVSNETGGTCGPTDARYWCGAEDNPWAIIEISEEQHEACVATLLEYSTY